MTKVTITLQDGEFIARHSDHVGIIGVGDTEQEALQELAEALGALAYSSNVVAKKKDELLELYREYREIVKTGSTPYHQGLKINVLEKELGEMK